MFFLFEIRDSNGNDCNVFDAIVDAPTLDDASAKLWAHLESAYPKDESDGMYGTYHACDCSCDHRKTMVCARCIDGWECCHGGLTTNEDCDGDYGPRAFPTYEDAKEAGSPYHGTIALLCPELK